MRIENSKSEELQLSKYLKQLWAKTEIKTKLDILDILSFPTDKGFAVVKSEGYQTFGNAIRSLSSDVNISKRVSRGVMRDIVGRELISLHKSSGKDIEKNSKESASRIIQELRNYPVEDLSVNFPVYGIELVAPSMEINIGNVTLYSLEAIPKTALSKWTDHLSEDQKKHLDSAIRKGIGVSPLNLSGVSEEPPGGTNCWAKVVVQANRDDKDRYVPESRRLVTKALALFALFTYATPTSGSFAEAPVFDIDPANFVFGQGHVLELDDRGNYRASVETDRRSLRPPILITKRIWARIKKASFETCSEALRTSDPSPLQRRIRRALEYYALAMRMTVGLQRYVMCVSGLEALLLREEDKTAKNGKLALRIAWLIGSNSEERNRIYNEIEETYKLRCKFVHGELAGDSDVEDKLIRLEWFLFAVIKRLTAGAERFGSVGEIVEWVRKRHLGIRTR